jgi:hypothetical protein
MYRKPGNRIEKCIGAPRKCRELSNWKSDLSFKVTVTARASVWLPLIAFPVTEMVQAPAGVSPISGPRAASCDY